LDLVLALFDDGTPNGIPYLFALSANFGRRAHKPTLTSVSIGSLEFFNRSSSKLSKSVRDNEAKRRTDTKYRTSPGENTTTTVLPPYAK
jgi:hypothetical protein